MNGSVIKLESMKNTFLLFIGVLVLSLTFACTTQVKEQKKIPEAGEKPRIVNIINFIRLLEPRDEKVTEDVLYQTVVKQVEMMNQYGLGGTFLLQYDALLDTRYQQLLKSLPDSSFEIGGWWEIPQPLCENAGLKWRGRFPWDWHAHVGFSVGYTPEEREKLVDVYMNDFKQIFGYYPKSVGSWFIDAHTLNYMAEKYGIVASCNCKDQIGTDGYTLWGGYWNQAYYPSKKNAYMPAQNAENQINVPVFRMLGSDPVRQYDNGLGTNHQGVVTLEPVYRYGGGDSTWVNWYFNEFVGGECLEFAYVQVGQENSFTWEQMAKGFEIQLPLIAALRDEQKVRVETLAASGQWFRERYKTTPATSVTVTSDLKGSDNKTVWFNSRFYRVNLLWENGTLRFRDIHLFNENLQSDYLTTKGTSNQCLFYTLPFIDGYTWSSPENIAGLRLKAMVDGKEILLAGNDPVVEENSAGKLLISWPLQSVKANLIFEIDECGMTMKMEGKVPVDWFLDLTVDSQAKLPFEKIGKNQIDARFKEMDYSVTAEKGTFSQPGEGIVFRITPEDDLISLNFSGNINR